MDTLWAIANKMRFRKEQGEFKTYRDAYRWAAENIPPSKVQPLTFQKLEKAYHKAKLEGKVDKLYNAITPLLANLKKNPEKEYIYWPNRTIKIEQFENIITKIINE